MNQITFSNAASAAAEKSKVLVAEQIERQARALGTTVSQTAHDLEQMGSQLRQSGTLGSAAELADWAARYVSSAGSYLENGTTDGFIRDLESFSRERPWAVAASALILGFTAARVIKSSSVKRFAAADFPLIESNGMAPQQPAEADSEQPVKEAFHE